MTQQEILKPKHIKVVFERRSLAMTPEQWAALDWIANQTDSLAKGGPRRGQPSWRNFIARIANESAEMKKTKEKKDASELDAVKLEIKASFGESREIAITKAGDIPT